MNLPEAFLKAMSFVEQSEGGTNFDPLDRGGFTKFGISAKTYPDLDIKNLTLYEARWLYYDDFWLRNRCGEFREEVSTVLFDSSVNCGVSSAARWIQQSCNLKSGNLVVDGIIGSATVATANRNIHYSLIQGIVAYRLQRYSDLLRKHPEQKKYIRGWIKRVSHLLLYVM